MPSAKTACAAPQPLQSISIRLPCDGFGWRMRSEKREARNEKCERLPSSSSTIEPKRVSQMLSAAITRGEQNTWHLAPATPESDSQREGEREREQQLRSTKSDGKESARAHCSCPVLPFHALFALACRLARTQQLHSFPPNFSCLPYCSLAGSAALSLARCTGRQNKLPVPERTSEQELRIIIRNFNSNSVFASDSISRIRFHCQIIDEFALVFAKSNLPYIACILIARCFPFLVLFDLHKICRNFRSSNTHAHTHTRLCVSFKTFARLTLLRLMIFCQIFSSAATIVQAQPNSFATLRERSSAEIYEFIL